MNTLGKLSIAVATLILSAGTASAQNNKEEENSEFKPSVPTVSGLINARYSYDTGTTDNNGDAYNGFDIRRTRLAVSGNFGKRLDYKIQAEYGGGKQNSAANVKLLDAFLKIKLAKEFNIQVGEFKVEYSQETLDGPATWITIENPTVVNKLNGYSDESGQNVNSRDVGIRFYGGFIHKEDYDVIQYKIGIYNGNGVDLKDNDKYKDVGSLLYIRPIKELVLSAGYYSGRYTANASTPTITRNRSSFGFTFTPENLFLRSEYLYGKTGDRTHQGMYATAAYSLSHGLQPLLSYGYYQKDTDLKTNNRSDYQIGVNWIANKKVRLQLAYTHTDYTNSYKDDTNLIESQLLVSF